MSKTYVTNIRHFLDENGELANAPRPARKLASFLVLLIDVATQAIPAREYDSLIRCRARDCTGSIRVSVASEDGEIRWHCPKCGQNGVITNWQGTKWDQTRQEDLVG